uniref:hypothetical protein n=1 Tax=Burkholderia sp. GbtcB21 TaxID=2824766 RepID=UPI001C30B11A
PAGTIDGLNLYRMVRNNPGTLRDSDGRIPVFPTEATSETAPHGDVIENMEQLQQYILSDPTVMKYIRSPKENCENAARRISALLSQSRIKFQIGGMLFWKSLLDTSPDNHYIVIAELNQESIYIDVTAGQFKGSSGETMDAPFFGSAQAWKSELLKIKSTQLVKFKTYPTVGKAAPDLFIKPIYSFEEAPLIFPEWYMRHGGAGEAEKKARTYYETQTKRIAAAEQKNRPKNSPQTSSWWSHLRQRWTNILRLRDGRTNSGRGISGAIRAA